MLLSFSPIHLPPVMALYAPNSLSEAVSTTVLVERMAVSVLVEDDTGRVPWNISGMQISVIPCVSALDGHIIIVHHDNIEIP